MTNFFLTTLIAISVVIASFQVSDSDTKAKYRLTEEEKIEIYEDVMNSIMTNNDKYNIYEENM